MKKTIIFHVVNQSNLQEQLGQLTKNIDHKIQLVLDETASTIELTLINNFLKENKELTLNSLELKIDPTNLPIQELEKLITTSTIKSINLIFTQNPNAEYLKELASKAHIPVHLYNADKSKLENQEFQDKIISNIQQNDAKEPPTETEVEKKKKSPGAPIKLKQLIAKKQIQGAKAAEYLNLEVVETVQEVVEIAETIEQIQEQNTIASYFGPKIGFNEFSDARYKNIVLQSLKSEKLVTTLYKLIQQELFANIPHAIKYLSPAAAEQIALNLPALVTLNKDNLPAGFVILQSELGELILDYDPLLEKDQTFVNAYTPVETPFADKQDAIYDLKFTEGQLRACILSEAVFNVLCKQNDAFVSPSGFINLYIHKGTKGISEFCSRLETSTNNDAELMQFIYQSYLKHIPQWDYFLEEDGFFNALEIVSHFDPTKRACLFKFLKDTGSSRHDLAKTVTAFNAFWIEYTISCNKNQVPVESIITDWETPKGGNPVVYMERMVTLFKNARSFKDQMQCLSSAKSKRGVIEHILTLANYDAYYASKYEDFKSVSARMGFDYSPEKQDARPFNSNNKLYRVDLEQLIRSNIYDKDTQGWVYDDLPNCFWLIKTDENLSFAELVERDLILMLNRKDNKNFVPPYKLYKGYIRDLDHDGPIFAALKATNDCKEFAAIMKQHNLADPKMELIHESLPLYANDDQVNLTCRYIGQQSVGIHYSEFDTILTNEIKNWMAPFPPIIGLTMIFFVAHQRYKNTDAVEKLFSTLSHANNYSLLEKTIFYLFDLYQLNICFNNEEALLFLDQISGMNSSEFENKGLSKVDTIEKLFAVLKENPAAFYKFLKIKSQYSPKWPMIYALDTAELLAKDEAVSELFHDDLLSFSYLLNCEIEEAYHHKAENREEKLASVEKVREYMHKAATLSKPNNYQFAFQSIIQSKSNINYVLLFLVLNKIDALQEFNANQVSEIMRQYGLATSAEMPEVFASEREDIRFGMMLLILLLQGKIDQSEIFAANLESQKRAGMAELHGKSIKELQEILTEEWKTKGVLLTVTAQPAIKRLFTIIKESIINSEFKRSYGDTDSKPSAWAKLMAKELHKLPELQEAADFDKLNLICNQVTSLARLFDSILKNPFVHEQDEQINTEFSTINFSKINYESLYVLFRLLADMPQTNYLKLLESLIKTEPKLIENHDEFTLVCTLVSQLNGACLPIAYLDACAQFAIKNRQQSDLKIAVDLIEKLFQEQNHNPVLDFLMKHPEMPFDQFLQVLNMADASPNSNEKLAALLKALDANDKFNSQSGPKLSKFIVFMNDVKDEAIKAQLVDIISMAHAVQRTNTQNENQFDYIPVLTKLLALSAENLDKIHAAFIRAPLAPSFLLNALNNWDEKQDFDTYLQSLEREPFGARTESQFAISELERIVNNARDLVNNTPNSWQYRKQLMEAFLFVNDIGYKLPVFNGKSAKELLNDEIRQWFWSLKSDTSTYSNPFSKRLLAIALLREAMYRSTGEFPFPSQILALIDGVMHEGDFISNIDTGQGKSLIDTMKAALLYLDADRVDLSTSSIVDARRDIVNYGSFLQALGIPYSKKPITCASDYSQFQQQGINFSTLSQFGLFFSKATAEGVELETPDTNVSLVLNESDYTLIDDNVIIRYASFADTTVKQDQVWIYEVINDFVGNPAFLINGNSMNADIEELKDYLRNQARVRNKNAKIVDKFAQDDYLSWIESALLVNYILTENEDFVIPEEFEKVMIGKREVPTKVAKVLMLDGKVSPDSSFGNGIQQLLYARLNKETTSSDFVLQPQSKTIISSNNKNVLNHYRRQNGRIWGSSGTVGSIQEVLEQKRKFNIGFGKSEPHQKKITQFDKPKIYKNDDLLFNDLVVKLLAVKRDEQTPPDLVFCRNITAAKKLHALLIEQAKNQNIKIQLYTGLGKEEDVIAKASEPGTITITTTALGRNTNINYMRQFGMNVWQTFVTTTRLTDQMAGRTGRQGSKGTVKFFFTKEELGKASPEKLRQQLDQLAMKEREYNEELYDVIGYLMNEVKSLLRAQPDDVKSAFMKTHWSKFSIERETKYRELRRTGLYVRAEFVEETLNEFKKILEAGQMQVPATLTHNALNQHLEQRYPLQPAYEVYSPDVRLSDCTPPFVIACSMMQFVDDKAQSISSQSIEEQLVSLFDGLSSSASYNALHLEYLHFAMHSKIHREELAIAHQNYIDKMITEHSDKLSILQQCFSSKGNLNKAFSNPSYLSLIQSLVDLPALKPDIRIIKRALSTVLDEYLSYSWFINSTRKAEVERVKQEIENAETIESMVAILAQSQRAMAKADAPSGLRMIKPLHFFGRSRYQDTLNCALSFTTRFVDKETVNQLDTKELSDLYREKKIEPSLDTTKKHANAGLRLGNKKVIATSLENLLEIKSRQYRLKGNEVEDKDTDKENKPK